MQFCVCLDTNVRKDVATRNTLISNVFILPFQFLRNVYMLHGHVNSKRWQTCRTFCRMQFLSQTSRRMTNNSQVLLLFLDGLGNVKRGIIRYIRTYIYICTWLVDYQGAIYLKNTSKKTVSCESSWRIFLRKEYWMDLLGELHINMAETYTVASSLIAMALFWL